MIHSIETDYERAERDALIALAKPGDVLFDVGAYVGWYSVEFARRVPGSKVYAYEPIAENRIELNKNIGDLKNVFVFPFGVADYNDFSTFYVSNQESGTASLAPLEEDRFGATTTVEKMVSTIDITCSYRHPPNFIKIDVEGAEFLVLKGARETLKRYRPIVLCEMLRKWSRRFNYHPNDIIDYMRELDYECRTIDGRPFTTMTNDTVERNFFFFPR